MTWYRPTVFVRLTPHAVGVMSPPSSREPRVEWRAIDAPESGWTPATLLAAQSERLAELVADMGLSGHAAHVCYASPEAVGAVFSIAHQLRGRRAADALASQFAEAVAFPLGTNPHALAPAWIDPRGQGARRHFIATADTADALETVAGVVEICGLTPRSLVPEPALGIAATLHALRRRTLGDGPVAVAWIGDRTTTLIARTGRGLGLVRSVPVGVDAIVDALTRPIASRVQGQTVALSRSDARAALDTTGLGGAEPEHEIRPGIRAGDLLPLLQPPLQRLYVELRQTIRFGIAPEHRKGVNLLLCGPGAAIPKLADAVGEACGAPVSLDDATAVPDETVHLSRAARTCPVLLPVRLERTRASHRITMAVRVGIACAVAATAFDGVTAYVALSRARAAAARISSVGPVGTEALATSAERIRLGARHAETLLAAALSRRQPWPALLAYLAGATPEGVRIARAEFSSAHGASRATLYAVCSGDSPMASAERIRSLIESLRASPVVQDARLGPTRDLDGAAAGLQFEVTLDLVTLPGPGHPARIAALGATAADAGGPP